MFKFLDFVNMVSCGVLEHYVVCCNHGAMLGVLNAMWNRCDFSCPNQFHFIPFFFFLTWMCLNNMHDNDALSF